MRGQPLEKAKQAALLAVRNLRPEDNFAFVTFSNQAQVVLPLQPAPKKEDFMRTIERIGATGSTNLTGGWMLGRDEMKKAPVEASRRLLLLSDGLLNVGIIAPETVRQVVVAGLQQDGIRTSCLGFGAKYNEDLMTTMAQVSGGQFYDADSPREVSGHIRIGTRRAAKVDHSEFAHQAPPFGFLRVTPALGELSVGGTAGRLDGVFCRRPGQRRKPGGVFPARRAAVALREWPPGGVEVSKGNACWQWKWPTTKLESRKSLPGSRPA